MVDYKRNTDLIEHDPVNNAKRVNIVAGSGGGGGGGTVTQGPAGTDPWLIKIDQSGTNNDVNISGTVATADDKVEDTGHTTGDTGSFVLAVRNALLADLTDTNLDYSPIAVDAKGRVIVDATGAGTIPVAVQNTVTVQDGGGSISVDDNGGSLSVDDGGGSLTVDGSVTSADSQTKVDGGTGFVQETSTVFPVGLIFDDVAGVALSENDIAAPRINANRAQVHAIEDGVTRARYATVSAANALKVDGSAVTQPVSGTVTADTELPAAAALSDSTANPTTPMIGAACMTWDTVNSTWAREAALYYQSTAAVGATGAGTAVDMSKSPCLNFTMNVFKSGTISNININLEGSTDNLNWFTLMTYSSATGANGTAFQSGRPARYFRYNVVAIAGGGTETIQILAMRGQ